MIAVRDATEKCIWPGHYMVAEGIKAFPKTGFYLYYPIVNRTELETGHKWGSDPGCRLLILSL